MILGSKDIDLIKAFFQQNKDKKEDNKITLNLEKQEIRCGGKTFHFEIDEAKKYKIINQIDTISEVLKKIKLVEEFEKLHEI